MAKISCKATLQANNTSLLLKLGNTIISKSTPILTTKASLILTESPKTLY